MRPRSLSQRELSPALGLANPGGKSLALLPSSDGFVHDVALNLKGGEIRDFRSLVSPSANRGPIAFTAWPRFAHAALMAGAYRNLVARGELVGVAVLVIILYC